MPAVLLIADVGTAEAFTLKDPAVPVVKVVAAALLRIGVWLKEIFTVTAKPSTVASACPVPAVVPEVKVAVAVPLAAAGADWMVVCALEIVPNEALPKVIGTPRSVSMLAETSVLAELTRKLAVRRSATFRQIGLVAAVCVSESHGVKLTTPEITLEGVLVPYQLFCIVAVPATLRIPFDAAAPAEVLSAMRL